MNRKMYKLFIILCLLLYAAGTGLCNADEVTPGSAVVPVGTIFIKFCITMGAVGLSILIIWICLLLFKNYAKEQFEKTREQALMKDSVQPIKNVDEAIISFINKNKL